MGFDVGAVLANLFLSYFATKAFGESEYAEWLLTQIEVVQETFSSAFITEWNNSLQSSSPSSVNEIYSKDIYFDLELLQSAQQRFLRGVWRDTLGYTAVKMIRRIVGIAHVEDLESIQDKDVRAISEKLALLFARSLLLSSYNDCIGKEGLFSTVQQVVHNLARPLYSSMPPDKWPGTI